MEVLHLLLLPYSQYSNTVHEQRCIVYLPSICIVSTSGHPPCMSSLCLQLRHLEPGTFILCSAPCCAVLRNRLHVNLILAMDVIHIIIESTCTYITLGAKSKCTLLPPQLKPVKIHTQTIATTPFRSYSHKYVMIDNPHGQGKYFCG